MMSTKLTPQQKAERTYNLTADFFDHPALGFWGRFGKSTILQLHLQPGMQVLDVCSGTGASAIPAAQEIGKTGRVTAVDLAENLLELARAKAAKAQLKNITFEKGDMTDLPYPPASFDAVVIVFGIFFIPEMEEQVGRLWKLVKPGGQLAVTTWGPRIFEPAHGQWLEALKQFAPELVYEFNPWDRITTPEALKELLEKGIGKGANGDGGKSPDGAIRIITEMAWHPLRDAEDFWRIAMGSGMRWPIERMGPGKAQMLKEHLMEKLRQLQVKEVETNVMYGIVRK